MEKFNRNDGDRQGVDGFGGNANAQGHAHMGAKQYRSICGKCGARRVDQQIGLEAHPDEFIDKLVAVFAEVRRVLHPSGQLFINISDTRSDSREWLGIPHRLVFALQADGWRWEDEVIWAKKAPMPGSQTNRFTRSHEYVFMLNKSRDAFLTTLPFVKGKLYTRARVRRVDTSLLSKTATRELRAELSSVTQMSRMALREILRPLAETRDQCGY